jgi:hypothetical protein
MRMNNKGILPEWFLDHVEIIDEETKNKYVFQCKRWFSMKKENCKIEYMLKEAVNKVLRTLFSITFNFYTLKLS